jgi:hypothetical protein
MIAAISTDHAAETMFGAPGDIGRRLKMGVKAVASRRREFATWYSSFSWG